MVLALQLPSVPGRWHVPWLRVYYPLTQRVSQGLSHSLSLEWECMGSRVRSSAGQIHLQAKTTTAVHLPRVSLGFNSREGEFWKRDFSQLRQVSTVLPRLGER